MNGPLSERHPKLEVISVRAIAWVQDGGRRGFAHHGVPPGGALCPERLAQANLAVGNAWDAPALELWGHIELELRVDSATRVWDGSRILEAGSSEGTRIHCGASPANGVRYIAVQGGLDVPEVLGGRGTLPVARLGGHEGRPLRRGDVIPLGATARVTATDAEADVQTPPRILPDPVLEGPLRFIPAPAEDEHARAALEAFCRSTFTLSPTSDRVGTRLTGTPLPRPSGRVPSTPMVRGALQLPPSGEPIVLGPDHPTTGGYPLLGVVIRADVGRIGGLPPGASVRFERTDLRTARALWTEHLALWR